VESYTLTKPFTSITIAPDLLYIIFYLMYGTIAT